MGDDFTLIHQIKIHDLSITFFHIHKFLFSPKAIRPCEHRFDYIKFQKFNQREEFQIKFVLIWKV